MGAPKGNRFWEARSSHGRKKLWDDPEQLWDACVQYFEWVEDNPLTEMKPFAYQGAVVQEPVAKMRAMTLSGICLYLGMTQQTWRQYRDDEDFSCVISQAEEVIRSQKFTGAAADLLNANIISRDLGLTDKRELEHSGSIDTMSDEQLDEKLKELINAAS